MNQTLIFLLLECLHQDPDRPAASRLIELSSEEWDELLALASQHKLRSLLFQAFRKRGLVEAVPAEHWTGLKGFHAWNVARNLRFTLEFGKIACAHAQAGVPLMALKGIHLAHAFYDGLGLRVMNDVDLMVPKENLATSVCILEDLGYRPVSPYRIEVDVTVAHHLTRMSKPGLMGCLELHWTLTRPGEVYAIDVKPLWERAVPINILDVDALALSTEDLLLHLCHHLSYQHAFAFDLRPLCDISTVIARQRGALDWGKICQRATEWRLTRGVYLALRLAHDLLGAEIPASVWNTLEPTGYSDSLRQASIGQLFRARNPDPAVSGHVAALTEDPTWAGKGRAFLRHWLIPRVKLAKRYSLSPSSPAILWFYLVRLKDMLKKYAPIAWRILRNDPQLAPSSRRAAALASWLYTENDSSRAPTELFHSRDQ